MTTHIFRVKVRGRFGALDAPVRARLLAEADDHQPHAAAFTPEGTLTYERSLVAFTLRYEMRGTDEDGDPASRVVERAQALAVEQLMAAGIPHRDVTVEATDMADVWRR